MSEDLFSKFPTSNGGNPVEIASGIGGDMGFSGSIEPKFLGSELSAAASPFGNGALSQSMTALGDRLGQLVKCPSINVPQPLEGSNVVKGMLKGSEILDDEAKSAFASLGKGRNSGEGQGR